MAISRRSRDDRERLTQTHLMELTIVTLEPDALDEAEGVYHHSYSALHTYASICSLQYRFKYIDRLPQERIGATLVFGSAMHEALHAIDGELAKGRPPQAKQALAVLRSYLEKAYGNRNVPVVSTQGDGLEDLFGEGVRLLEYYASVLPSGEVPLELSRSFKVPLFDAGGEALPRPLRGELDRWVRTKDGRVGIGDWKTSDRRWSKRKVAQDDQATAYFLGGEHILGRRPDFFRYELILKTKEPEVERYPAVRTAVHTRRFVKKVQELDKAIKSGIFLPNDDSFACPTCPFRNVCEKWQD
jgi:RecB family exonuclease